MPTVEEVKAALSTVNDPDLNKDLVTLGMIKNIQVEGGSVQVTVELTTPACPLKAKIQEDCEQAVGAVEGVEQVKVEMTAVTRGSKSGEESEDKLPGVKNVILVASGKGGVGKSSVAINLAATLARRGAVTGLLDADIYGPSIPTMMGVSKQPQVIDIDGEQKMIPVEAHGVGLISIGFFLEPAQAVMWRGPMLHKALDQFTSDVHWGEMDAFSHVNNVTYFRYFETARIAYFDAIGYRESMEEHGVGPILASTSCTFRRPLSYPDDLVVGAGVSDVSEDGFTMQYAVWSSQLGTVAARGEGAIVNYDYRGGRHGSHS